jgi:DNA-nicking Smr family endonuclease
MNSKNGSRPRNLLGTDRAVWENVKNSIKPLRGRRARIEPEEVEIEQLSLIGKASKSAPKVQTPIAASRSSRPPLAPLERQMKKRLARGSVSIDARIDLHGKTQHEAHRALLHFLRHAQNRSAMLVLVITGKGISGDGERGVLKRQVPVWLSQPDMRDYVIGFDTAHISHGGEGALYVRIRKAL